MKHTLQTVVAMASMAILSTWPLPAQVSNGSQRAGLILRVAKARDAITLVVTLEGSMGQPSDPDLSTGVPEPSQILAFTGGDMQVRAGDPVSLTVERSGAVWTPYIGVVQAVLDETHILVSVDQKALDKTWQDPSDGNTLHPAGDYLLAGAPVSIAGPTGR